ncbi:hypothetical protein CEXT_454301 [Caerostris extrusa]|uniref:Uncharacterized protein n=1 Tax=Caerostris extrusa TaxID=172846 RepID=A0AAV4QNV9_CAEEX|nr:hypothetical protein CEXT_454301 [Caerostris extrusa]
MPLYDTITFMPIHVSFSCGISLSCPLMTYHYNATYRHFHGPSRRIIHSCNKASLSCDVSTFIMPSHEESSLSCDVSFTLPLHEFHNYHATYHDYHAIHHGA